MFCIASESLKDFLYATHFMLIILLYLTVFEGLILADPALREQVGLDI